MKGGNVQINWHDNKPVLTLDFHPIPGTLATGGADLDIKKKTKSRVTRREAQFTSQNDSPVEKAENVPTEAMAANNLITTDSEKSKAEWDQLTEAETKGKEVGGEENESLVEKPDDMVLDSIVAEKIGKSEAEMNEGKNELPIINKPTKRRITPMAIDP